MLSPGGVRHALGVILGVDVPIGEDQQVGKVKYFGVDSVYFDGVAWPSPHARVNLESRAFIIPQQRQHLTGRPCQDLEGLLTG